MVVPGPPQVCELASTQQRSAGVELGKKLQYPASTREGACFMGWQGPRERNWLLDGAEQSLDYTSPAAIRQDPHFKTGTFHACRHSNVGRYMGWQHPVSSWIETNTYVT